MVNNKNVNSVLYEKYKDLFEQVMGLVELTFLAVDCGKQNDVATYLSEIKTLAQCTDDCSCSDGTPALVVGLGSNSINVSVVSGGAPITVTSATVGATTTYTITFSAALVTKINASYNTVVAASTGISVASATVGDVTTYTVSSTILDKNFLAFKAEVAYSSSTGLAVITVANVTRSGTVFTNAPTVVSNNNTVALENLFTVGNMLTTPPVTEPVKIFAELVMDSLSSLSKNYPTISTTNFYKNTRLFEVEVVNQTTNGFGFRIYPSANALGSLGTTNTFLQSINATFTVHLFLVTT